MLLMPSVSPFAALVESLAILVTPSPSRWFGTLYQAMFKDGKTEAPATDAKREEEKKEEGAQVPPRKKVKLPQQVGQGQDASLRAQLRAGYKPEVLPRDMRHVLWEYIQSRHPYFVKFRGHDLKTRPKLIFADPNESGEYPLYRWGQEKKSYDLVEPIPASVRAVMELIEAKFGAKTKLAMATYYWNGTNHYIPAHQDKRVTVDSEGAIETASQIFNIALGAVRPFVITALGSLGKAERAEIEILEEFQMSPGDLYVLEGGVNARFGHAVPRDTAITEQRVSWVSHTVNAAFVNPGRNIFRTVPRRR